MTPTVLRTQDEVWAAGVSMETLVATYRAMTGDATFVAFDPPESARSRTAMSILSAEHAAGRAGVPKHGRPSALTAAQRAAKIDAAANAPDIPERKKRQPNNSSSISSMEQDMATKKPSKTKDSPQQQPRGRPAKPDFKVRATGAGKTKVRAESARGKLLAHITASKKAFAVSDLDAAFNRKTLGDVRVLIQLGHLTAVE